MQVASQKPVNAIVNTDMSVIIPVNGKSLTQVHEELQHAMEPESISYQSVRLLVMNERPSVKGLSLMKMVPTFKQKPQAIVSPVPAVDPGDIKRKYERRTHSEYSLIDKEALQYKYGKFGKMLQHINRGSNTFEKLQKKMSDATPQWLSSELSRARKEGIIGVEKVEN